MTFALPAITVGWVLAMIVLILCIVFAVVGMLPPLLAVLIGGVALARLL